jgi:uncharacterized protein (DUF433 family)
VAAAGFSTWPVIRRHKKNLSPWDKLKVAVTMDRDFVESRHGSFYLIGSRVPLAHLVLEFQQGEPPEAIRSHYRTLSLEQVYGAITFYLGNKEEVEKDIAERARVEDEFTKTHPAPPPPQGEAGARAAATAGAANLTDDPLFGGRRSQRCDR